MFGRLRSWAEHILPRPTEQTRRVRVGRREVVTRGIAPNLWSDAFHVAMNANWPGLLGGLALVFVLINLGFAILYDLDPSGVANAQGRFLNLFFFSVETLTTVGYGELQPASDYAHVVVSAETFVGIFYTASMLGLIFARLSRPRARLMFADKIVIGPHEGRQTLFLRVANARANLISSATARLWFLTLERTQEDEVFRRFRELPVLRAESPALVLSWTILHVIDEASPLCGRTAEDLKASDTIITLAIVGRDETSGQTVHASESYLPDDICWGHRYVDILTTHEDGTPLLDYRDFHKVEPLPANR